MKTTSSLRKRALSVLEEALSDENPAVRLSACRIVLGKVGDDEEDEAEVSIFTQAEQRHEAQQASRGFQKPEDDDG